MAICKRCNKRKEVCSCFSDPRVLQAHEKTRQEEQRLQGLKEAAESKAQAEEEQELRKYCADSLCMACELCIWTSTTANATAAKWARSYKAIRELPMEERQSRVEAYAKEERDYLVWQRQQDGGKLPWMTSQFYVTTTHDRKRGWTPAQYLEYVTSARVQLIENGESPAKAAPFTNGEPRARKFCRSKPQGRMLLEPCFKYTRKDFKKATQPAATIAARVQKHWDLKGRLRCDICGGLNHSARDKKRCPMQQAD